VCVCVCVCGRDGCVGETFYNKDVFTWMLAKNEAKTGDYSTNVFTERKQRPLYTQNPAIRHPRQVHKMRKVC